MVCLDAKRRIGIADILIITILIIVKNVWKKTYLNILSLVRIADTLGTNVINEGKIREECVHVKSLNGVPLPVRIDRRNYEIFVTALLCGAERRKNENIKQKEVRRNLKKNYCK